MGDQVDHWRETREERQAERAARLAAANAEFAELARVACTGDMTLAAPGEAHWILKRSQGKTIILQFWPSAEKVQMTGQKKSRHCTLTQFRAMLHDQLGCPPILTDRMNGR